MERNLLIHFQFQQKGHKMLRSLWSGVSGMQGHQIALDVESNNIANVNTNGFKYDRAEFSTMITQQRRGATIPYGGYGGRNEFAIGLGTEISTTTKVFSQGSLQNTDRKTDLAISGNGLFVISANNGFTRQYTRDGAFGFDAVGNLTTTSGYIVQGWLRDLSNLDSNCGIEDRNIVDSTGPIKNITIDPRLQIPAKATTSIGGSVNLTSGVKTNNIACPSPLDSDATNNYIAGALDRLYDSKDKQQEVPVDMGVAFNKQGEALRLQESQGVWISYQTATSRELIIPPVDDLDLPVLPDGSRGTVSTSIVINDVDITWQTRDPNVAKSSIVLQAQVAINNYKDQTGVEAVIRNGNLVLQNTNSMDGDDKKKNIRVDLTFHGQFLSEELTHPDGAGGVQTDNLGRSEIVGNGIFSTVRWNQAQGQIVDTGAGFSAQNSTFINAEDWKDDVEAGAMSPSSVRYDSTNTAPMKFGNVSQNAALNPGDPLELNYRWGEVVTTAFKYQYTKQSNGDSAAGTFHTTEELRALMQQDANRVKVFGGDTASFDQAMVIRTEIQNEVNRVMAMNNGAWDATLVGKDVNGQDIAGLQWMQNLANVGGLDPTGIIASPWDANKLTAKVVLNENGNFDLGHKSDAIDVNQLNNLVNPRYDSAGTAIPPMRNDSAMAGALSAGGLNALQAGASFENLNIMVSAYSDTMTTSNVLFKNMMKGLNTGILVEGGSVTSSGAMQLATFGTTIEVFDSLGNKHEVQFEFTKTSDREWSWRAIAPEPAEFIGAPAQRPNIIEGGSITFGEQGEVLGFNPNTLQFKPNSGAAYPQQIAIDFGSTGGYDGFTSNANESQANNFGGNGYAAGILKDFTFDATGTMIGNFDNGQNLALAQVAVATFANYEGLSQVGSNMFAESPNSGSPTWGPAGTGGRGAIAASKLEMSNTDLSRGLTQLIVVQRGFQASSKSVTTSDQILNTLLQLKQ